VLWGEVFVSMQLTSALWNALWVGYEGCLVGVELWNYCDHIHHGEQCISLYDVWIKPVCVYYVVLL